MHMKVLEFGFNSNKIKIFVKVNKNPMETEANKTQRAVPFISDLTSYKYLTDAKCSCFVQTAK